MRFVSKAAWLGLLLWAGPLAATEISWDKQRGAVIVTTLPMNLPDPPNGLLKVYVGDSAAVDLPSVLGETRLLAGSLVFKPRFDFQSGLTYTALFEHEEIQRSLTFTVPEVAAKPSRVLQVFPSVDVVPENLLKLYVHFSAPMRRRQVEQHIRLFDENDQPMKTVFLHLKEELWGPDRQRLTLFFDPGRIKTGLQSYDELGQTLNLGRQYKLVVHKAMRDANGNPLDTAFTKTFKVGPAVRSRIHVRDLRLSSPAAGTKETLILTFPRPMDHALLERLVRVSRQDNPDVRGKVMISPDETMWQWRPEQPWRKETYRVSIASILEDLAGNTFRSAFETGPDSPPPLDQEYVELSFNPN